MPFLLPQAFLCSGIPINLHLPPFHSGRGFTRIPIPLPTFQISYTLLFQSFLFNDLFLVGLCLRSGGHPSHKQHIPSLEIWHIPVTLPGHNLELGYVFLIPEGRTSPQPMRRSTSLWTAAVSTGGSASSNQRGRGEQVLCVNDCLFFLGVWAFF